MDSHSQRFRLSWTYTYGATTIITNKEMMKMTDDGLLDYTEASAALGIDEADLEDAVADEGIRVVKHEGVNKILGADVSRVLRERDPKWLAAHGPRLDGRPTAAPDDDDPDDPRHLARNIPRL